MSNTALYIKGLKVRYGAIEALKGIDMEVKEGDVVAIANLLDSLRPELDGISILTSPETVSVAQALGETAPLLLIGMSAFVASVPATPLDQSTALPVQIFLFGQVLQLQLYQHQKKHHGVSH